MLERFTAIWEDIMYIAAIGVLDGVQAEIPTTEEVAKVEEFVKVDSFFLYLLLSFYLLFMPFFVSYCLPSPFLDRS